ncbi:MAG TPA: UvrD-helicase domain-containing protein, partial [Desulfosarcina sp.]|nr:UvrD-helicase domain-containing protein [Desulfosarcina sp.]
MSTSSSVNFLPLTDTDAVDLSRHALVEASAGTGKTYTVENLVVRLLKEEPELQLENILLVTFTEKATGELKLRIRRKIEQTLDRDMTLTPGVRGKLADALDRFDSAAITTIHGFCHTLLKEFPIETGSLFHQEVIDDKPLLEQLLKDRMRSDWPRTYGPRLKVLLDLAGFSNRPDRFVQAVINLALRLRFDRNHETLIPDPAELDLESLWRSAREAVLAVKALVGPPGDLVDRYQRLNINQRTKTAIVRDLVAPVLVAVERADDDHEWLAAFKAPIDVLVKRHSSGMRNLDRLVPEKWLKGGENLHECPNL